ncbi:MAG: DUF2207 domain-containing protein [Candidatus Paceibacteria bacterium]
MIWKHWILGSFIAILMSIGGTSDVYADQKVSQLNVNLTLKSDASLEVTETIQYDVGTESYPQFQRTIPNNGYTITVNSVSVDGESFPYNTSQAENGKRVTLAKDAYQFRGTTEITITYTVNRPLQQTRTTLRSSDEGQTTVPVYQKGAVQFFPKGVQFRWDVVDDSWNSPIKNTQVTLKLPQSLSQISDLETKCFTGKAGSTESACSVSQGTNVINVTANRTLQNEFFTIVVAFGSGVVETPGKVTEWRNTLQNSQNTSGNTTTQNAGNGNLQVYLGIIGGICIGISLTFFAGVMRKKSTKKKKRTRKEKT